MSIDNTEKFKKLDTAAAQASMHALAPNWVKVAVVGLVELLRQYDARLRAMEEKNGG